MTRNMAASVRSRLSNQAKRDERPFQELLQYYGLERFLYRLSRTPYAQRFLLKGALMLRVWDAPGSRPTRDIDLLGFVDNDVATLKEIVRDICVANVDDDGLRFDASLVSGERIKEGAEYEGVRITFAGFLERARIPMQLDIGFGDVVHPEAKEHDYPTILDFPAPRLRMYPRTTVIAEKFEAMVYLGTVNSRFKDFFDIWLLSRQFDFDGPELAQAITMTFERRNTMLTADPVALTASFATAENTQKQWAAFLERSSLSSAPRAFTEIAGPLRQFLLPVTTALTLGHGFTKRWIAPGPWE